MSENRTPQWLGGKYVWGMPVVIKPIINAPPGAQRLRFRNIHRAILFVKSPEGIRKFDIIDKDDHWELGPEQGRNVKMIKSGKKC